MKNRSNQQLKNQGPAELAKQLVEQRNKLWTLKTDLLSGKVKNVREISTTKKTIARILTILSSQKSV